MLNSTWSSRGLGSKMLIGFLWIPVCRRINLPTIRAVSASIRQGHSTCGSIHRRVGRRGSTCRRPIGSQSRRSSSGMARNDSVAASPMKLTSGGTAVRCGPRPILSMRSTLQFRLRRKSQPADILRRGSFRRCESQLTTNWTISNNHLTASFPTFSNRADDWLSFHFIPSKTVSSNRHFEGRNNGKT